MTARSLAAGLCLVAAVRDGLWRRRRRRDEHRRHHHHDVVDVHDDDLDDHDHHRRADDDRSAATTYTRTGRTEAGATGGRGGCAGGARSPPPNSRPGSVGGCQLFPRNSYWYADVSTLPVHGNSDGYVVRIGANVEVHPDFLSGLWEGGPIGMPYAVVGADQPLVPISFHYQSESDPGPYPIPPDVPIEEGGTATAIDTSSSCKKERASSTRCSTRAPMAAVGGPAGRVRCGT